MNTNIKDDAPPEKWKDEELIKFLESDSALQAKEPAFYSINKKLRNKVRAELLRRLRSKRTTSPEP